MPENSNTEKPTEQQPLDTEDWELAFAAYKGYPGAALMMGFNLMVLKPYVSVEPLQLDKALEGIERAIEVLYPFTQFHEMCHDMYVKLISGDLTVEEEEKLKKWGIKF